MDKETYEKMLTQGKKLQRLTDGEKAMLAFGAWLLQHWYEYDCNDIDGGDLQNYLDKHITQKVAVSEPCHPTACKCEEFDAVFPGECTEYREGILEVLYDYGYDRTKEGVELKQ